jgi:hypothetical protein
MIGALTSVLGAAAMLATPAGGYHGHYVHGRAAHFQVGAAVRSFTPPAFGHVPGGDPANCAHSSQYDGPRHFAFEEPYVDAQHHGHYDLGDPFIDCNHDERWDGNLLGGGGNTPRYFDHVADPVTARAMVVSNGAKSVAVEVVDQEGLFNVYQQRIRAKVRADGYRLSDIFISSTHDESAPDSMGLGGVSQTTSGVNNYWVSYLVNQSARAIERADRAVRRATIRYSEVLEPSNLRQCWSSYPFVDDQHIPVLQAVDARGATIVTLASVSQHAETLGFNGGTPALEAQNNWLSSDWSNFFRGALQQHLGGVAIEMAGSVGSVESPEVYPSAIPRAAEGFINASHPAGCRTLFSTHGATDTAGALHVPLGYAGETKAFGTDMAAPIIAALRTGKYHNSQTNTIWGGRANICIRLQNELFVLGAALGVFAQRPAYNANCTVAASLAVSGASSGQSLRSQVAAFQIGDGEFISVPGEVFPFTYLRGFFGPQDMPDPSAALPPWLLPHMHAPFRFIDGLGEDMLGYIFPAGNAVGIPTATNLSPSSDDRFGCHHSDDSEATSSEAGNIIGDALVRLLDRHSGTPERTVPGRYILTSGRRSRDPLGGPEIKCMSDQTFHFAGRAVGVALAGGRIVHPARWMSLSGLPQRRPDRDTRGYFDARGRRVWLDVFPQLA